MTFQFGRWQSRLQRETRIPEPIKAALADIFKEQETAHNGFTASREGARLRSREDKLGDVLNVKDFGALGDGTSDNAFAFAAARDNLEVDADFRGGVIEIPEGHFRLNATLAFTAYAAGFVHNIILRGKGPQATVLDFTGAPAGSDGITFDTGAHFGVENLTVISAPRDGISVNAGGTVGTTPSSSLFYMRNVRVQACGRDGVRAIDVYLATMDDVWSRDNDEIGFNFPGIGTSLMMRKCSASGNGEQGYNVNGYVYSVLDTCTSDDNLWGYVARNCNAVTFLGCGSELNEREGWLYETSDASVTGVSSAFQNLRGVTMIGCYAFLNDADSPGSFPNFLSLTTANSRAARVHLIGCVDSKDGSTVASVALAGTSGAITYLEDNCTFEGTVTNSGTVRSDRFQAYTPAVASTAGTITTVGAVSGRFKQRGNLVTFEVNVTITTNGTGAGQVTISLPAAPGNVAGGVYTASGRQFTAGANQLSGSIANGTQSMTVTNYDGTYPGADGMQLVLSGTYEVAL